MFESVPVKSPVLRCSHASYPRDGEQTLYQAACHGKMLDGRIAAPEEIDLQQSQGGTRVTDIERLQVREASDEQAGNHASVP